MHNLLGTPRRKPYEIRNLLQGKRLLEKAKILLAATKDSILLAGKPARRKRKLILSFMIKPTNLYWGLFFFFSSSEFKNTAAPFSEGHGDYAQEKSVSPEQVDRDGALTERVCESPERVLIYSFQTCRHRSKTKRSTSCSQFQLAVTKVTGSVESQGRS